MARTRVAVVVFVGVVVPLAVLLSAGQATATSSWRCGARLIGVGQTMANALPFLLSAAGVGSHS